MMRYQSTRGGAVNDSFSAILLEGLADDGGLIVPATYPHISNTTLSSWRSLSYPQLAAEIMALFINDIDSHTLQMLTAQTYTPQHFDHPDIVSITPCLPQLYLLGLTHGPTLAFKDMAMQCLGNLFEYVLQKQQTTLNIIGATSGDTGSAAEYAMRAKSAIYVFMLSPQGRMSPFQRAQMYSLNERNIFNIAVDGNFDDCQDLVKAVHQDHRFKQRHHIGAVNSINWGRILAQVVYYFKAYLKVCQGIGEPISFVVPSGNFGNVYAGHLAKQMGLPIARLIVATNENDVLHDFLSHGNYRPRSRQQTLITSSPSMDISKASNIERFIFDLLEQDSQQLTMLWQQLHRYGGFDLSHSRYFAKIQQQFGFYSGRSTHQDRLATIAKLYSECGIMIDPHTADGVHVALQLRHPEEILVCLETASPIKFAATIYEAIGLYPQRPEHLRHLEELPQYYVSLANDVTALKQFMLTQFATR